MGCVGVGVYVDSEGICGCDVKRHFQHAGIAGYKRSILDTIDARVRRAVFVGAVAAQEPLHVIGDPVAVRITLQGTGLPAVDDAITIRVFLTIEESVAIAIGIGRVGAELKFGAVGEAIAIGIALGTVIAFGVARVEAKFQLPFIGEPIFVHIP